MPQDNYVFFPVAPGQIVYARTGCFNSWFIGHGDINAWVKCKVVTCKQTLNGRSFSLMPITEMMRKTRSRYHRWFGASSIGLTVFLTEQDARAKLD